MVIPLKIALFDPDTGTHGGEELVMLDKAQMELRFPGHSRLPYLSINRGFTAPVRIERASSAQELAFLSARDDDPFARYEALQQLASDHLLARDPEADAERRDALVEAMRAAITDPELDDSMRGELLLLPAFNYLAEQVERADPGKIHAAREGLKGHLASKLGKELSMLYSASAAETFSADPAARGRRKVHNRALGLIAAGDATQAAQLAADQYDRADNMTDRQGALMVLAGLDVPQRAEKLADFHARYEGNELAIDKWFAIQAISLHPDIVAQVSDLATHPDFTLRNPNRVRSLYMAFAGNPHGFHAADGSGYAMIADLILSLDPINPQTAARFVPPLGRWGRIEEGRAKLMRGELERISASGNLSRDTFEQVTRSLG
jgi:aminopeptidase N